MPRIKGAIDWESPDSWDAGAAVATIDRLAHRGKADVPIYSITANRQVGHRLVDLAGAPCFLAEGIFAAEIVAALQQRDLLAAAYALRRPRLVTFVRRLVRDLHEHRKPPAVLVRRGLALYRSEPRVLARQLELGCQAASPRAISRAISRTLA
jgi:uridine kinase